MASMLTYIYNKMVPIFYVEFINHQLFHSWCADFHFNKQANEYLHTAYKYFLNWWIPVSVSEKIGVPGQGYKVDVSTVPSSALLSHKFFIKPCWWKYSTCLNRFNIKYITEDKNVEMRSV